MGRDNFYETHETKKCKAVNNIYFYQVSVGKFCWKGHSNWRKNKHEPMHEVGKFEIEQKENDKNLPKTWTKEDLSKQSYSKLELEHKIRVSIYMVGKRRPDSSRSILEKYERFFTKKISLLPLVVHNLAFLYSRKIIYIILVSHQIITLIFSFDSPQRDTLTI